MEPFQNQCFNLILNLFSLIQRHRPPVTRTSEVHILHQPLLWQQFLPPQSWSRADRLGRWRGEKGVAGQWGADRGRLLSVQRSLLAPITRPLRARARGQEGGPVQAGRWRPPLMWVRQRQGTAGRSACRLLAPILPMTNETIRLSSLSLDFNVMCPRQLLNILNVSLTRTNPVEFFSNFPIR